MEDYYDSLLEQIKYIDFENFKPGKCELPSNFSLINSLVKNLLNGISFEYNQDHVDWGHYLFTSNQHINSHLFICLFTSLAIPLDDIVDCSSKGNFQFKNEYKYHK